MKTLAENINWYREIETRKWKRIWHCIELSIISVVAVIIPAVMFIYGDGTSFQPVLIFFTLALSVTSASLIIPFYQSMIFKRWHIQVIIYGFMCGVGLSALAGFLILGLQQSGT